MKTTLILLSVLLTSAVCFAGSATWNLNPTSNDWNTATNWTPNTVPNGPSDIATLATSTTRHISLSDDVEVSEIVFNSGASPFRIDSVWTAVLTISGTGITNASSSMQQFVVDQKQGGTSDGLRFTNSATAGANTILIASAGETVLYGTGGAIYFEDQASADHSVIQVYGAGPNAFRAGQVNFYDNSTAGDAIISTLGAPQGIVGDLTFADAATAGNATISNGRRGSFGGIFYFLELPVLGAAK
jgi:hypothetical protein